MRALSRSGAVVAGAAVASLLWTAPAVAGGQGDPLYGDVNGDRRVDEVVLGGTADACTTTVRLGRPGGGYGTPTTRSYPVPQQDGIGYCPDMGVVVDLGSNGTVELVLAWFDGSPTSDYDLMVLRDWTPAGGFRGQMQPSRIGLADFNGDGRMDVWETTDQGDGLSTFINGRDGRLTPGAIQLYADMRPDVELVDLDRDGATDVLAHSAYFGEDYVDVVVAYADGRRQDLHLDDVGDGPASAEAVRINGDKHLDVRVTAADGTVTSWINAGDGSFRAAPTAVADTVRLRGLPLTVVDVLANDAATPTATVRIVSAPRRGVAAVNRDGSVTYLRIGSTRVDDTFVYELREGGLTSRATVTVQGR